MEPEDREEEKRVTWGAQGRGKSAMSSLPDVVEDEDNVRLTPLGRYQLMNGLKKFDITYRGDPDLQPIRTNESKFLVRMLHAVSSYFNEKVRRDGGIVA